MNCNYCINTPKKAIYLVDNKPICKTCLNSSIYQKAFKAQSATIEYIQNKQVNRYNLPIDQKYTIVEFDSMGSIDNATTCQNCNRIIVNTATVKNEQGYSYIVGLDCAETLSLVNSSDFWKIKEQEAFIRKISKYISTIKKLKKEGKTITTTKSQT